MPVSDLAFRWAAVYLAGGLLVAGVLCTFPPHPLPWGMAACVVLGIAIARLYGPIYSLLKFRSPNKRAALVFGAIANVITVSPILWQVLTGDTKAVVALSISTAVVGIAGLDYFRRNIEEIAGRRV